MDRLAAVLMKMWSSPFCGGSGSCVEGDLWGQPQSCINRYDDTLHTAANKKAINKQQLIEEIIKKKTVLL